MKSFISRLLPVIIILLIISGLSLLVLIIDLFLSILLERISFYLILEIIIVIGFFIIYIYLTEIKNSNKELETEYKYYEIIRYREDLRNCLVKKKEDLFVYSEILLSVTYFLVPILILIVLVLINCLVDGFLLYFFIQLISGILILVILGTSIIITFKEYKKVSNLREKVIERLFQFISNTNFKDSYSLNKRNAFLKEIEYLFESKKLRYNISLIVISLITSFIIPIFEFISILLA